MAHKAPDQLYFYFTSGEKKEISHDPFTSQNYAYSKLSQGFIDDSGNFACRGGFVSKALVSEIDDFESAFSYAYDQDRLAIFQFGALQSNSEFGRECFYTTIDTETGTILQENQRLLGAGHYFVPSKFDLLSSRTTENKLIHYLVGGSLLRTVIFAATGLITVDSTPNNVSHPYAIVKIGNLFSMMCFSADSSQEILGISNEAWGALTPSQKHILFEQNTTTKLMVDTIDDAKLDGITFFFSSSIHMILGLRANEIIYKSAYFADSVFFVSNKGLVGLLFPDNTDNIATQTRQRTLSTFTGRNVQPVSLHANYLYYCSDEIRFRDISKANVQIHYVGDFVALPNSVTHDYIASTYLPEKDTLLFLTSDGQIKTLIQGKGGSQTTTFLDCTCFNIIHFTNTQNRLFAISRDDDGISAIEYDPTAGRDIRHNGSTFEIDHEIAFPFYPRSYGQHNSLFYFDKQGGAFTATPGNNIYYQNGDRAILSLDLSLSDEKFAGGTSFKFSIDKPALILSLMLTSTSG